MLATKMPLTDITNLQVPVGGKHPVKTSTVAIQPAPQPSEPRFFRHDPYNWKCLATPRPEPEQSAPTMPLSGAMNAKRDANPVSSPMRTDCDALVQFKCHQSEYSSPFLVQPGQYVVVEGDRGVDIGVVIGVNSSTSTSFAAHRSMASQRIVRHATQKEVDYWALDLKEDEAAAVSFCKRQVAIHKYDMEVVQAEYQFDKKKLTFYYAAHTRIDFVALLKELYREFGCRIWMEKVMME